MPQRFEGLFLRSGEGWGFFIDDYVNHSGDAFLCTQYMYKKVRNRSDEGSNESNAQPVSRAVYIGDKYVHVHTHTHTRTHSHSPAHLTSKKNKTGGRGIAEQLHEGCFWPLERQKVYEASEWQAKKRQQPYCQRQQMNLI